jgi:hypothetical protein
VGRGIGPLGGEEGREGKGHGGVSMIKVHDMHMKMSW